MQRLLPAEPLDDGYYLSTYLTEPGLPFLLSSWTRHDNNVSLWHKTGSRVTLVHYWELERFSGIKHHGFGAAGTGQATALLDALLADAGVSMADVVECWGTPGTSAVDRDPAALYADVPLPYHSICHLFSAALLEGPPRAGRSVLGFAVDGGPDFVLDGAHDGHWYAGGLFRDGTATFFPVESPGPLYNVAAQRYGMEEGTLMALATASPADAALPDIQAEILSGTRFHGRSAFSDSIGVLDLIDAALQTRLAGADLPAQPGLGPREHLVSAAMKQVQRLCVAVMERNVDQALAGAGVDARDTDLALAGGYALNCPTNSHLMARYGFRRLLAPPCVNDGGQSLGIALATFAARLPDFDFRFPGAYLGSGDGGLAAALDRYREFVVDARPMDLDEAVRDLRRGPVAWVNGRAELGPRALGNRSILCDPTGMAAKHRLNQVKGRQPWRPVAPVVLCDRVTEWFADARPSPYMLETFAARPVTRSRAPAILHVDGSARVQTVAADQNPLLYRLIGRFAEATGVPILGNTSLNDKGEPIVQTAGEAVNFCLRKGLPVAYLAGHRLEFGHAARFTQTGPAPRGVRALGAGAVEVARLTARYNPCGVEDRYLQVWLRVPAIRAAFDLTDAGRLPALRRAVDEWLARHPWERDWYRDLLPAHARYLADLDAQGFVFGAARQWRATPAPQAEVAVDLTVH